MTVALKIIFFLRHVDLYTVLFTCSHKCKQRIWYTCIRPWYCSLKKYNLKSTCKIFNTLQSISIRLCSCRWYFAAGIALFRMFGFFFASICECEFIHNTFCDTMILSAILVQNVKHTIETHSFIYAIVHNWQTKSRIFLFFSLSLPLSQTIQCSHIWLTISIAFSFNEICINILHSLEWLLEMCNFW